MKGLGIAAAIGLTLAAPAGAAWREARTKHFIVYSEGNEEGLRDTATRLEQFDALMRLLNKTAAGEPDQPANPLTVYIVADVPAVRRLYGDRGSNLGGFYVPRANGSIAFTPRSTGDDRFTGQIVLFHEYSHHFLLGNYTAPYPAWFSEGYAEFMSTVRFTDDLVEIGRPAEHRVSSLYDNSLSAERLFSVGGGRLNDIDTASLYARGWLLTHYIMLDAANGRRFDDYMRKVAGGMPNRAAAEAAFGDLGKLNRALDNYLRRNRFGVRAISRRSLPVPKVTVRALGPGENAMLPLRMRSTRGVNDRTAAPIYAQGARIAAAYPNDAVVQGWLAEMAFDAGDDTAAEAAADRALAADPASIQALLYKAQIHLRRAMATKGDAAAWKEARSWIVRANKVDNNDTGALWLYYRSFMMAGAEPNKSAIAGLYRASQLVPQDPSLRWMTARQYILDGDTEAAKATLRPLAYDPHARPDNPAARLVALLDGGAKGKEALAIFGKDGEAAAGEGD